MSAISKVKDLLQERIIGPIKSQCPANVPMKSYLELIFHTHTRIIARYNSPNGPVTIPGRYCLNGFSPVEGLGMGDEWRTVRSQKGMLVRHDEAYPNVYHIDHLGHVFQLTRYEWRSFKQQLRVSMWSEEL